MNKRSFTKSSVKTVDVAFEVPPLMISPLVNFPNIDSSNNILPPASKDVLSPSILEAFNIILFSWFVSVSNLIPSVVSVPSTVNSADSIKL